MKNIFKYILLIIPILIFIIVIYLYFYSSKEYVLDHDYILRENNSEILLKSVSTPQEQNLGLGGIDYILDNEGMLFIFSEDTRYPFWMKDVKFSLDIIFLDSNYRVVHISRDADVCNDDCPLYISPVMYRYVIEVKAGITERFEIEVGDVLKFDNL